MISKNKETPYLYQLCFQFVKALRNLLNFSKIALMAIKIANPGNSVRPTFVSCGTIFVTNSMISDNSNDFSYLFNSYWPTIGDN